MRWILEKRGKIGEHLCGIRKHLYQKNGFLDVFLNPRRDHIKEMLCQIENAPLSCIKGMLFEQNDRKRNELNLLRNLSHESTFFP